MKTFDLKVDGKLASVAAERIGEILWFHVGGETFSFKPESRLKNGKKNIEAGSGELLAPMPGKITQIRVAIGDPIEFHQILVVMEAMKMEYTLKAPRKGVAGVINCKVGDQVAVGQELLMVIEEGVRSKS